jgi:hypothetical protein
MGKIVPGVKPIPFNFYEAFALLYRFTRTVDQHKHLLGRLHSWRFSSTNTKLGAT